MNDPSLAIEINHLVYAYVKGDAVHDLTIAVPRGRCYGLFGRNGAGKTTTMKCLLNLLRPRGGSVARCGTSTNSYFRRNIGSSSRVQIEKDAR